MSEQLILGSVFVAVLLISFVVTNYFASRREIARNIENVRSARDKSEDKINKILGNSNPQIRYYLDVVQNDPPNSLRMRLVQAGYFSRSAQATFNLIRLIVSSAVFLAVQLGVSQALPSVSNFLLLVSAMVAAAIAFILCSAVLENMGKKRTREFRKLFPDFMDLLLVCVDAGLSINAALDRVTREFLVTTPDFGVQLSIINLETRAGRPIHEALTNFSKRVAVEEARTLAVLFRQSAELGASVSKTLRVFAAEMRQMRLIRAEEKANSLPIKMLFPMAAFMFPVNLVIVLVPIIMIIIKMLGTLSPGG